MGRRIYLKYSLVGEMQEKECQSIEYAMERAYSLEEHLTGLPLEIIDEGRRYKRIDMQKYWEEKGWRFKRDDVLERAIERDHFHNEWK